MVLVPNRCSISSGNVWASSAGAMVPVANASAIGAMMRHRRGRPWRQERTHGSAIQVAAIAMNLRGVSGRTPELW